MYGFFNNRLLIFYGLYLILYVVFFMIIVKRLNLNFLGNVGRFYYDGRNSICIVYDKIFRVY